MDRRSVESGAVSLLDRCSCKTQRAKKEVSVRAPKAVKIWTKLAVSFLT